MKILLLGNPKSGVSYIRLIQPVIYMMKTHEEDFAFITNHITDELLEEHKFDIVLISRSINMLPSRMAELKEKYGFTLIVDNDDYWNLDPHHILYDSYLQNGISQKITNYLSIADVCTVTHERLANEVYEYNKNIAILPNALPYGHDQYIDAKTPSDKVRLFWAGSDTHAQDLSLLRGPMNRIYSDGLLRNKIKVVMSGYSQRSKPVWDVMVSAFTCSLRLDTSIYNFADPEKYMHASCDSDICFVPLLDTRFNKLKSNLKVLEAAAKKNPAIVSYCHPYHELPVCYAPTQGRWYQWTKELVNDEATRKAKGQELFDFCNKHYNLFEVNKKRHELYSKYSV